MAVELSVHPRKAFGQAPAFRVGVDPFLIAAASTDPGLATVSPLDHPLVVTALCVATRRAEQLTHGRDVDIPNLVNLAFLRC